MFTLSVYSHSERKEGRIWKWEVVNVWDPRERLFSLALWRTRMEGRDRWDYFAFFNIEQLTFLRELYHMSRESTSPLCSLIFSHISLLSLFPAERSPLPKYCRSVSAFCLATHSWEKMLVWVTLSMENRDDSRRIFSIASVPSFFSFQCWRSYYALYRHRYPYSLLYVLWHCMLNKFKGLLPFVPKAHVCPPIPYKWEELSEG